MTLRIRLASPAPPHSQWGNQITASRWQRIFRLLGHHVGDASPDVLVALHALKSRACIAEFQREFPGRPVVLVLTGTEIYGEEPWHQVLQEVDRIVVLQHCALETLPPRYRSLAHVILQAASPLAHMPLPVRGQFRFLVGGHLRSVKDPLRAALAARELPRSSRIRVVLLGQALEPELALEARREETGNFRFRWLGERPHGIFLRMLAASQGLILSSRSEGGPNVLSEAIACGVPVLASHIPGARGVLGEDYQGYYEFGDTQGLLKLMQACEMDPSFLKGLTRQILALQPVVRPAREVSLWKSLLDGIRVG